MWTGAGGEQAGSGKEYWEAGQAHGKGIKQGGAGTRMSREQAEVLEPASQAAPLWLHSRFPSCFSDFPVFRDFFPPHSGGKCHIAEQVEDLLIFVFWGVGQDTLNQTPS